MKLNEEQIVHNWNELLRLVKSTFSGERKDNILKMLEYFEDRMCFTPASAKEHFHCAYPGGFVEHTLNVINNARILSDVWKKAGCNINFTDEELVFSALFHDLGKVGDLELDYYIPQEDEWRRKKLSELYTLNPKLDFMHVTDRTFVLLAHFNIPYSNNEFLAIRLADGLYAEHNKSYLMGYTDAFALKTNLPYIIHASDFMSMHSEYDAWKNSSVDALVVDKKEKYQKKQTLSDVAATVDANSVLNNPALLFDELFKQAGEKK